MKKSSSGLSKSAELVDGRWKCFYSSTSAGPMCGRCMITAYAKASPKRLAEENCRRQSSFPAWAKNGGRTVRPQHGTSGALSISRRQTDLIKRLPERAAATFLAKQRGGSCDPPLPLYEQLLLSFVCFVKPLRSV